MLSVQFELLLACFKRMNRIDQLVLEQARKHLEIAFIVEITVQSQYFSPALIEFRCNILPRQPGIFVMDPVIIVIEIQQPANR